ncbi:MAG: hypothetical protein ACFFDC_01020 [Promethearchaeota archaeon]
MPKRTFYSNESYEFHEYADIFPLMNSQELNDLGESLRIHKQEIPITLFEDKILDGRNRYLACRIIGKVPKFHDYNSKLDPLDYVRIKNLHKRHLSTAQRAVVALKFIEIERRRAKERIARKGISQKILKNNSAGNPGSLGEVMEKKGRAIDIVAKEHKIAPKSLIKAEKIEEASKDDPEIKEKWEKAKNNELSLEEVYRALRRKNEIKIRKGIVEKFTTTGQNVVNRKNIDKPDESLKLSTKYDGEKNEKICKFCPKATVLAISCEMCGHLTPQVLCDYDFINNQKRLINPYRKMCLKSSKGALMQQRETQTQTL